MFYKIEKMEPGTPTFDQLRIFLAVVDEGSFAGAGRRLNRATSAISYGISNLEAQLGVELFDRAGTRRPRLTEAGHAVLAEARAMAERMAGLRARVKGLTEGLEAEVHLAVDVMVPMDVTAAILTDFQTEYPTVAMRLHVEALGAVTELVLAGRAMLGISGPLAVEQPELERVRVACVPLVPVAASQHPLARQGPLKPGAARGHVQLVLSDRSRLSEGRDFSVISPRTWRLGDLGAKHALLRRGIGWGNMPLHMIARDLEEGVLTRLALPDHPGVDYDLSGIYRSDTPPGPATAWLLSQFAMRCSEAAHPAP